jgi:hypothetical protein
MKKNTLLLVSVLSLALPACVVTTTAPRDVGSVAADGSVYLGWHLLNRDNKNKPDNLDQETYDIGAQVGGFSTIRLHADKPIAVAQVLVIFANGERWAAPAPAVLGQNEWSAPIQLPGAPRPIHSIVVTGRSTTSLLAHLELHGGR